MQYHRTMNPAKSTSRHNVMSAGPFTVVCPIPGHSMGKQEGLWLERVILSGRGKSSKVVTAYHVVTQAIRLKIHSLPLRIMEQHLQN